jgi:hypothetical protein
MRNRIKLCRKKSVLSGKPLKKVGFQIKKGAIPHFNSIEKSIMNQMIPSKYKSL